VPDPHPIAVVANAIGLGAFATTGAIVATHAGVSAFGGVAIATINAVVGGAVADILLDRAPFVLFEDFYATCAVLGCVPTGPSARSGPVPPRPLHCVRE
jgi:uncharacterized membrane protein YeiH